jgi:hypothetical protein
MRPLLATAGACTQVAGAGLAGVHEDPGAQRALLPHRRDRKLLPGLAAFRVAARPGDAVVGQ